jgi:hypothetical protein
MTGEAKVTLPKTYCISLLCDTVLWTCTIFTPVLFRLCVSFCLWWMAKIEQCVYIKFCVKISKSATETVWNASWGFWRTFFKLDSSVWMTFTFQGLSSVSWRGMFTVTKHQQNDTKWWQIWEFIHEDHHRTIHEFTDTIGISYGVCQEILTENLNMNRTAPSSRAHPRPWKPKSLWLTTTWLSFPILPTCCT